MVNNKHYYYSAIAYGFNNYKTYDPTDPTALDGQKKPYLEGRKNILLYTGIPHIPVNGIIVNSTHGDGPKIKRIEGQGNGGQVLELSDETVEEILSKPPAGLTANGDTIKYGDPNYPIAYNPVYLEGHGPVNIQVIDPLNVKNSIFSLKMDTVWTWYTFQNVSGAEEVVAGGDTAGVRGVAKWYLLENETGKKYVSDVATTQNFEQLFPELGISINFGPVFYPGIYKVGEKMDVGPNGTDFNPVNKIIADDNGLLLSSIEYADSSRQWLDGVTDVDGAGSFNWIRSGTNFNQTSNDDWRDQLFTHDPEENYEVILGGTFAPYFMCAMHSEDVNGPVFNNISKTKGKGLRGIASIDIVLTPDKSKWTRCPVIEMSANPLLAENGGKRFFLRKSASVDKDGNPSGWPAETEATLNPDDPNYVLAYGMGWFPGYVINLETGERMNMMFGEDSWLAGENGRDMLFNPTPDWFSIPAGNILFGGKHYLYVMSSSEIDDVFTAGSVKYSFPAYDAGYALATAIDTIPPIAALENIYMAYIYSTAMYVGIPVSVLNQEWLSNEAKIKIRISKPYENYYSQPLSKDGSLNNHFPMYEFSTASIATTFGDADKKISDLDLIKVVPNPYYAFAVGSGYEEAPLQNKVKITNLPEKCTVSIYNVSGTLIRKLTKDSPVTYIDWDLKNHAGIPIAGGVYIIHVKDHTTNEERIVKWFGSLRVEDFKEF